ncbi:MAG: PQQ-like beta-propeller repeat protein [Bacteroidales bacterium]|nr:PQQ-like beta-propeller repeat protein [Bacteroidales bacterium]
MKQAMLVLALLASACIGLSAQSRNGWRGPENNGSYPDKKLLDSWPEDGPKMVFEVMDAGKGYSSPQVVGDRIYLTGLNESEDQEVLNCYTLDGKKIYAVAYGKPWERSYPEVRTTPTFYDGKIYVISGHGDVACLNAKDGKIVWALDGGEKYARKTGNWGSSECALVYDDKVIYSPGGDITAMVALNRNTGEEIWRAKSLGERGSYATPILITYKGKRQIIATTPQIVYGVNPDNGEIEWTFDDWGTKLSGRGRGDGNITPNAPLFRDGKIFYCHGYNLNGFQLQLADDLKSVSLLWRTDVMDTHHGGYVLVGNYIYGSNWINNNAGNWCCIDWNTGETKYETAWEGKGKGSIITADNKLICFDERRGTVGLVKANPEKFEVVSEFRIEKGSGPCWAHPTISNGILYIRHGEAFYAFKIK